MYGSSNVFVATETLRRGGREGHIKKYTTVEGSPASRGQPVPGSVAAW